MTNPPAPMPRSCSFIASKSTVRSRFSGVINEPEDPPIWIPFNFLPSLIPSAISSRMVLNDVPISISITPESLPLPATANIFVPGLSAVPRVRYHSGPFCIITGTFIRVSTLLITVGFPNNPDDVG